MSSHSSHHSHHSHHRRDKSVLRRVLMACMATVCVLFLALIFFMMFFPDKLERVVYIIEDGYVRRFVNRKLGPYGIDVSHHQGVIDWKQVAASGKVRFVYLKATEGTTHRDSLFSKNVAGALNAGLPVGVYHFLSSKSSMSTQFHNFINVTRRVHQQLIPMVDVEPKGVGGWSPRQVSDSLAKFVSLVRQHYGCLPLVYIPMSYHQVLSPGQLDSLPLFVASYSLVRPKLPGARRIILWQKSEHGRVAGIHKEVDVDVLMNGAKVSDLLLP